MTLDVTHQDNDVDTERRILMAAVALVDEHGEAGLRISDLVESSGRSVGSIYHFFGNREGLVEAVRAYRFDPTWEQDLAQMQMVVGRVETLDQLLDAVEIVQASYMEADRHEVLWQRVAAIGSARARPNLRVVLAEKQQAETAAFEEMIEMLQSRGIVGESVDVYDAAVFLQAFTFGRILAILDGTDRLSAEGWAKNSRLAVEAVLRG
jgi:AcrR family transcriptional regulator